MNENLMPQAILEKALIRGNEYAWKLSDIEEAINAGRVCRLATVGGQAQFRLPDGTCEMYWISATATPRVQGESWSQYVERSATDVRSQFRQIAETTDFRQEATKWPLLVKRMEQGDDILNYLCFVLYFDADKEGIQAQKKKGTA